MIKGAMNDDIGTTKIYLPFNNNFESAFVSDEMGILAPCSGSVKSLTMKVGSVTANATYSIEVGKVKPGSASTVTIIDTQTRDLTSSNDYDVFTVLFDDDATIAPSDLIVFSVQTDVDAASSQNYYFSAIIAWDYSSLPKDDTTYT